eukprot:5012888-Amphidinium_carterae.1
MAHPPYDLARIIEATAFHTAKARNLEERTAFETKLLNEANHSGAINASFVDPTHLYHEYYAASVLWHQELVRSGRVSSNTRDDDCVITAVRTIQPPVATPLLKLNATTGALEHPTFIKRSRDLQNNSGTTPIGQQ